MSGQVLRYPAHGSASGVVACHYDAKDLVVNSVVD